MALSARAVGLLWLDVSRTNSNVRLSWTNSGAGLQSTPSLTGAWLDITGAVSPYVVSASNSSSFFRLRATSSDPRYRAPTFTIGIGNAFGCGCVSPENPNSLSASGSAPDNGGEAVLLQTGELTQDVVDLEIPGRGFDWRFHRRYRSGMSYDGPMGQGWDFNYNLRLVAEPGGNMLRVNGLGRVDRYVSSGGVYQAPGGFYTRLVRNPDGTFTERDPHGSTNSYAATNALGIAKLTRISDRNGNQMTFQYNTVGQLTNVADTLARNIAYAYDSNGRLTTVTDFAGRTLQFAYNGNGDLVAATSPSVSGTPTGNDFPLGKTTVYAYASGFGDARFNHNLLSVTAPNEAAVLGPARLVAQYITDPASSNADRVLTLTLGGTNASGVAAGGTIRYSYSSLGPAASNDFASVVFQNTVTNRNGNRTEYRFNQLGNIVRAIQFTRGLRAGEPAGFTNTFAYNGDGEMIGRTNAEGDSATYSYNPGSPDRLQQGNLLQVVRLPGPRGGDQTQILTSTSYETNFNFAVADIDGRGNTTMHRYDSRGNRTNTVHRIPSIVDDFEYNAFGQMTARVLPGNGSGQRRRDTMSYYISAPQTGYLQSRVVDSGGFYLTTTFEYDAVGNVVRMIDPRTNDTLYAYNALNQLLQSASRPDDGGTRYTNRYWYDANDNLVRTDVENRDATGALQANATLTTISEYDILNQQTREIREKGSATLANNVVTYAGISVGLRPQFLTEEYRYDADGNRSLTRFGQATSGADPFNVVQTAFDERDLPFRVTRAPGGFGQSTTQTDYDRNANATRSIQGTESAPRTNSYSYDGFDRLVRALDPMGNTQTNHYDANHNRVSERTDGELTDVVGSAGNVRLAETSYAYDAMDRLIARTNAFFDPRTQTAIGDGQAVTLFAYTDNSQLLSVIDDNTNRTTYTYDRANRPGTVTDARTNSVTYSYDRNCNPLSKTNLDRSEVPGQTNQGFTVQYQYDRNDRLTVIVDNGGNTNRYSYDSRYNRSRTTDGRGNYREYIYDSRSRRLVTAHVITTTGDGSGAVIGGITNRQTWDDSSRLATQTDGNGNLTQYFYDSLDRLISIAYADDTSVTNGYDVHGNRSLSIDANGTVVAATFDLLNRVVANTVNPAPNVLGATNETYSYDGLSRIVRAANDDSVVSNRYDSLSHLTLQSQQVLPDGPTNIVAMAYDGVDNLTALVYPSGRTIVRTFDSLNRVKVSRDDPPGPGATNGICQYVGPGRVARLDYGNGTRTDVTYDAIPRVRTIQHSAFGAPFYDHLFAWNQSHDLLLNTNRLFAGNYKQYQYDSVDRLFRSDDPVQFGTSIYGLDAVGNRTNVSSGSGGTYTMDPTLPVPGDRQANQYTSTPTCINVFDEDGNLRQTGQNASTALNYDFHNRLVQLNIPFSYQVACKYDCFNRRIEKNVSGNITRFAYAGCDEIEEQLYYGNPLATYVWCGGQLLQMNRNSQAYFYHCDQLGSTVSISDSAGNVVESNTYDDYGLPSPGSSSIANPYFFAGQRFDPETGWYLSGDHYLDPAAGRFITRVPGTSDKLANSFTFANNNPLSPYASSQEGNDDDEPPPHFECGQHMLWWYQHHPNYHGGRRKRPLFTGHIPLPGSPPIEILPLGPSGSSLPGPDGPVVGGPGWNDPPPGGCPGLPDPKRWNDPPWPEPAPSPVPLAPATGGAIVPPPGGNGGGNRIPDDDPRWAAGPGGPKAGYRDRFSEHQWEDQFGGGGAKPQDDDSKWAAGPGGPKAGYRDRFSAAQLEDQFGTTGRPHIGVKTGGATGTSGRDDFIRDEIGRLRDKIKTWEQQPSGIFYFFSLIGGEPGKASNIARWKWYIWLLEHGRVEDYRKALEANSDAAPFILFKAIIDTPP